MSFCVVCNLEQIPAQVWQDTKVTVSWASCPLPRLVETETPAGATRPRLRGTEHARAFAVPWSCPSAGTDKTGKKHPHLPVRDDLNWESLANKLAPAFWRSPAEAETLHSCIWRDPL